MTVPAEQLIRMRQSRNYRAVGVYKRDGVAVNISAATAIELRITTKPVNGVDEGDLLVTASLGSGITITDGAAGEFTIDLTATQTAGLYCDGYHELWIVLTSGKPITLQTGRVQRLPTATRAAS